MAIFEKAQECPILVAMSVHIWVANEAVNCSPVRHPREGPQDRVQGAQGTLDTARQRAVSVIVIVVIAFVLTRKYAYKHVLFQSAAFPGEAGVLARVRLLRSRRSVSYYYLLF